MTMYKKMKQTQHNNA